MTLTTGILQAGTNSHLTSSEEANGFVTDFIAPGVTGTITNTSGVAPSTGSFAANAQGTPNMTVAVSAGIAYVTGTPTAQNSQTFRVKNSASANVTISANSSGSTKFDWLYISLSATNLANPAVAADNVATLVTSRSSSASTDNGTPPTYGYAIAVITVANGASSITNGNIADKRSFTGVQPSSNSLSFANFLNPYKFSAYLTTSTNFTNGSYAATVFNNIEYDTSSNYSTSTGKFTAPINGFYDFVAVLSHNNAGSDSAAIALYKNGSVCKQGNILTAPNASVMVAVKNLKLVAGDYIQVFNSTTTAGLAITVNQSQAYFMGGLTSAN